MDHSMFFSRFLYYLCSELKISNMENEIWKEIENYEGLYQISNLGRVKSLKCNREKILKQTITHYGYLQVGLSKDKKTTPFKVHRLLMIYFVDNPESKAHVNHINGIKTDNRLENLEWCTPKENCIHKYDAGLYKHSEETKRKISITGQITRSNKNPKIVKY